jgi:hypothetical protein
MMRELESHIFTEIKIDATADQVWAVLTDLEKLPEWSSSFQGVNKPMALGEVSTAYFKNPITGSMMEFTHKVIVYEEGRAFGWSGDMMLGRQDHHIFRITELPDGCAIFKQEDGLNGKKRNFLIRLIEAQIAKMYDKFNRELKERVESLYPRS